MHVYTIFVIACYNVRGRRGHLVQLKYSQLKNIYGVNNKKKNVVDTADRGCAAVVRWPIGKVVNRRAKSGI